MDMAVMSASSNKEAVTSPEPWLTPKEAAKLMRRHVNTVYRRIKANDGFPFHKEGDREYRLLASEVNEYLKGKKK